MAALEKILAPEEPGGIESGFEERQASRPIDLVFLARQSLGDQGLEDEILLMFDQLALTHLSRIRETTDPEIILYNLHSLKGAAAGVGANNIATLARAAEVEMRKENRLSHEALADLRMAVEEVRHFIAEVLEN